MNNSLITNFKCVNNRDNYTISFDINKDACVDYGALAMVMKIGDKIVDDVRKAIACALINEELQLGGT